MGMIVNKKQLSEIFGISERSFTEYQKDLTFPYQDAKRGQSNEYDTALVFEWLKRREALRSMESAKERLDRLRGDREELAIAKEIGELLPAEEVERKLTEVAIAIRSAMLTGNSKLKNEIDITYGINLDVDLLNKHARQTLTHLSALAGESESGGESCPAESPAAA